MLERRSFIKRILTASISPFIMVPILKDRHKYQVVNAPLSFEDLSPKIDPAVVDGWTCLERRTYVLEDGVWRPEHPERVTRDGYPINRHFYNGRITAGRSEIHSKWVTESERPPEC